MYDWLYDWLKSCLVEEDVVYKGVKVEAKLYD